MIMISLSFSAGCFFTDDIQNQTNTAVHGDADTSSDTELPGAPARLASAAPTGAAASSNRAAEPRADVPAHPPGSDQGEATVALTNEKADLEMHKASTNPEPSAELQWTNIDLKEAQKHAVLSVSSFADTSSLCSLGMFSAGAEEQYGADEHPLWAWVSGGGCLVDLHSPLKWFTVPSGTVQCTDPPSQCHLRKTLICFFLSQNNGIKLLITHLLLLQLVNVLHVEDSVGCI